MGLSRAGHSGWGGCGGAGPERATHFDVPDHGAQAGLCSRLGQIVASIERGSSCGVFAGGLGPGEGGRGAIRCPPLGQGKQREGDRGDAFYLAGLRCSTSRVTPGPAGPLLSRLLSPSSMGQVMAGAAPDRSRQAGPTSQSSQESAERPSFLGLDSKPEYSLEGLMLRLQYFGHLM